MIELKRQLYELCLERINLQIDTAKTAMDEAQKAANEESKSSAGDKFETGRAMMQRERDKNARQLTQVRQTLAELSSIVINTSAEQVERGSLVLTNKGIFYIAVGLGKVQLEDKQYFIISLGSPIGKLLFSKKVGDSIIFNKQTFNIKGIY